MLDELSKLKLGKGAAFVKRDLQLLPQTNDVWEADFMPLPAQGRSRSQEWLGVVVSRTRQGRVPCQGIGRGRPDLRRYRLRLVGRCDAGIGKETRGVV